MSSPLQVSVTIVTYNSSRFIRHCLESLLRQTGVRFDVTVVDNASTDGTRDILRSYAGRIHTFWNLENVGFAAAQNQAIARSTGEWVLVLNPDVVMEPGFLAELYATGKAADSAGTICGKLLSIESNLEPPAAKTIDSAGIYFTPAMRHFDRGWHEPDDGRFDRMEYVFGASAAAALYRRSMIADVADGEDFFDPDFFAYREDADVAWRAQLLGWKCIYTPHATAYHVRRVSPLNRRSVPPVLNMHSVKNRFLMRIKNTTGGLLAQCWMPMFWRDLQVLGGCLFLEPASLPAFWKVASCMPRVLRRRKLVLDRRRVSDAELSRWFQTTPMAEPVREEIPQPISA